MKNRIYLRITEPKLQSLQLEIKFAIEKAEASEGEVLQVELIDDSDMTEKFAGVFQRYEKVVSLSPEIKVPKGCRAQFELFRVSRVFDSTGGHVGWHIPAFSPQTISLSQMEGMPMLSNDSPNCCVIDTDVSTGSTRQLIAKIFSGADFFAPIVLKENEDLIDLEDLLYQRSYLVRGDVIEQVSYLLNGDFFKARTSLSQTTYQTLLGLLG